MSAPQKTPELDFNVINITKNTKGFRFNFKPIENNEDIQSYRIYEYNADIYSLNGNVNSNQYLIKEIPYSEKNEYVFHVPKNTGMHYLVVFSKNKLGIESSGVLFSGLIPYQNFIREIGFKNINYYTELENTQFLEAGVSGGMINTLGDQEVTTTSSFCYLGWQLEYNSKTTEEVTAYDPSLTEFNFQPYLKDRTLLMFNRVIPSTTGIASSGILSDYSLLKFRDNDIYVSENLGFTPIKSPEALEVGITRFPLRTGFYAGEINDLENRYFIFDYIHNYKGFLGKNEEYVEGTDGTNTTLLNPKVSNITGSGEFVSTGVASPLYVKLNQPGHYSQYFVTIEAEDEDGDLSGGGNINDIIAQTDINLNNNARYSNPEGFQVLKINHAPVDKNLAQKIFKNYKRQDNYKIVFEFKDYFPEQANIDAIVLIPMKYKDNINDANKKEYFDQFIFIRNLQNDPRYFGNPENYVIESLDSQYNNQFKLTTFLSQESPLIKDNIFSVKLYYLNSLQSASLNNYLNLTNNNPMALMNYIENTDIIDQYLVLNKFIKDISNYTSTIAASYQGLVYFFTPESFPYISWPNESYRDKYLNKYGARMLDFERDGIASGPQFFNYFPQSQAEINDNFLSGVRYKTTYRCLDSYKYSSAVPYMGLDPEDVPESGIIDNPSYLGGYDPGNIGDQESPEVIDFKAVKDELRYFAASNIYSVRALSAGIQKNDAYLIIEFVLEIPEAEDFIVQGISGTDSVLEKGIKEINGVKYHYFVAKFVSSCGIDNDPILYGEKIDTKNIIDSKKMISFVVYPTKFKIIEDPYDVPFFGDFYLLATDPSENRFNILKKCPFSIVENNTDCIKGCCADELSSLVRRVPYNQFYILSKYAQGQSNSDYPYGKIAEADQLLMGSLIWNYKAVAYQNNQHIFYYRKPTDINNILNLSLVFNPEHNVAIHKILIYSKQIDSINNITWRSSDVITSYAFSDVVKSYPVVFSVPDFDYVLSVDNIYQDFVKNYTLWTSNQQTFAIRIYVVDKSGDTIEQTFVFINNEAV